MIYELTDKRTYNVQTEKSPAYNLQNSAVEISWQRYFYFFNNEGYIQGHVAYHYLW